MYKHLETPPPAYESQEQPPPPPLIQPTEAVVPGLVTVQRVPETFGPVPKTTFCPSCHAQITSKVEVAPSTTTHIIALLICALGGCLCAWIPYVVDSCQSKNHMCPACNAYLGTYKS